MTITIACALLLALLPAAPLLAASPRVAAYTIDAAFVPADGAMEGTAEIEFAAPVIGAGAFYLHGELRVESMRMDAEEIAFEQEPVVYRYDYSQLGNRISFQLPAEARHLTVTWKGYFNPSKARSPSDYMHIGPEGVLLRALGYSPWFPIFGEPGADPAPVAFRRVSIRTPKDFTSVSTGELLSRTVDGESQVSTWRGDGVSLHAAQVTARRFVVHRKGDFYAYSLEDEKSRTAASDILAFMGKLDGEYRRRFRSEAIGGQLHVMQMPRYGDISSGNVVGLSDGIWFNLVDDANARRALAHELVHPFVTPPISRSDPLFAMVVEGFPSYFHLPVLADLEALDYDAYMDWTEAQYLEKRATGKGWRGRSLPEQKAITAVKPDEIGVYKDVYLLDDRALLFLDYLRRRMGSETFDRFAIAVVSMPELSLARFRDAAERFLPGIAADVDLWLTTTEFPERLRRKTGT